MDAPKSTAAAPREGHEERELRALEERYRRELMGEEARCELDARIARLRSRLGRRKLS